MMLGHLGFQLALLVGLVYGYGFDYNFDPATKSGAFSAHVPGSVPTTHWGAKDGLPPALPNYAPDWGRDSWNRGAWNQPSWYRGGGWNPDAWNRGGWNPDSLGRGGWNPDWNRGYLNRGGADYWNRGTDYWNRGDAWNRGNWNYPNRFADQLRGGDPNLSRYWDEATKEYKWTCNTGATYVNQFKSCVWNDGNYPNQRPFKSEPNLNRYWDEATKEFKWACAPGATYSDTTKNCFWNKK